MDFYLIGKIVSTHGLRGEVKVLPDTDFDRFFVGATIYADQHTLKIKSVRSQNDLLLIAFEGLNQIDDVIHLKGLELYTKDEPKLLENEYHFSMLVGKPVYTSNSFHVGMVESVVVVPQGHLLRIETVDHRFVMVPFVGAFVKEISDDGIWITPIEGLL